MNLKIPVVLFLFCMLMVNAVLAQSPKIQQGLLLKAGTALRLGNVKVLNKRSKLTERSNTVGVFNIAAGAGDTLSFSNDGYLSTELVVTDLADKIIYLQPIIELPGVVIKENSIVKEIREAQKGYRKKSVFYTGTPHYYYLVLKPMTFIYENFKSEVKDARRFNRFAARELNSLEIAKRYNNSVIKQAVPEIDSKEIDDFRWQYRPSLEQLNIMSDYDVMRYIQTNYAGYKSKNNKQSM